QLSTTSHCLMIPRKLLRYVQILPCWLSWRCPRSLSPPTDAMDLILFLAFLPLLMACRRMQFLASLIAVWRPIGDRAWEKPRWWVGNFPPAAGQFSANMPEIGFCLAERRRSFWKGPFPFDRRKSEKNFESRDRN